MEPAHLSLHFSSASAYDISLISAVLDANVANGREALLNGAKEQVITLFHASADPQITMNSYVARIEQYGKCSSNCYLYAVILMDRIIEKLPQTFLLSGFTAHRLYGVCILLASKMLDDIYYSNRHWARVLGVSLQEMNLLEGEALKILHWRTHVSPALFQGYLKALTAAPVVAVEDTIMVDSSSSTATTTTTSTTSPTRTTTTSTTSPTPNPHSPTTPFTPNNNNNNTAASVCRCKDINNCSCDAGHSNHSTPRNVQGWGDIKWGNYQQKDIFEKVVKVEGGMAIRTEGVRVAQRVY